MPTGSRTQGPITPVALHTGRSAAWGAVLCCEEHQLPPSSRLRYRRGCAVQLVSDRLGRCALRCGAAKCQGCSAEAQSKLISGVGGHRWFAKEPSIVPHPFVLRSYQVICSSFLFASASITQSVQFFLRQKRDQRHSAPKKFFLGGRRGGMRGEKELPPDTHC